MLRISVTTRPEGTTITLEGRVVGAWVVELSACWQQVLQTQPRPICIDLDGVTFVDGAGMAVLRAMHIDGGELSATNVMMRAVIDQIADRRASPPPRAVIRPFHR